jgi:hypothetical protein
MPTPGTTISTGTVGALTLANMLGSNLFGISVERIAAALIITVFGVFGRLGWEIYASVRQTGTVNWAKVFALSAAGLISAISITILILTVLKLAGIVNDDATIFSLLFFGFIGPDCLPWLFNLASSLIKKRTGLDLPQISPTGDIKAGDAKP